MGRKHPQRVEQMWAYQATMIAEARLNGGRGWQLYDRAFRQHASAAGEPGKVDFGQLNQSIYTNTFLAHRGGGQSCLHCLQSDHMTEECALAPNPARRPPVARRREPERRWKPAEPPRARRGSARACFAFNDGHCAYANCRYEHVCSTCGGADHKKEACRSKGDERERVRDPRPKNR